MNKIKRRASIKEALLEGTYLYFKGVYGECNAQALQIWVRSYLSLELNVKLTVIRVCRCSSIGCATGTVIWV